MGAWSRSFLLLTTAAMWTGCGAPAPVAVAHAALQSCNADPDCSSAFLGRCVRVFCNPSHICSFGNNGCMGGCVVPADCQTGIDCTLPTCGSDGSCDFTQTQGGGATCQ